MAIKVSRYLPPGSYITEEVVKPIPGFIGLPRQICLIGEGETCKKNLNEYKVRGYVFEEEVVPDALGRFSPLRQSNLRKSETVLFKNDIEQDPNTYTVEELIPTAPTAGTPTSGGSVDDGTHSYRVTFIINGNETVAGTTSSVVTTGGGTNTVPLSNIPIGPVGTTARRIYRTVAGAALTGPWLLLATLSNNTATTYVDTTADASLGTTAPTTPTGITLVTIDAGAFDTTADYKFSYQSLANLYDTDTLNSNVNNACGNILFVGSFPGTKNFIAGDDYVLDKPNNSIEWLSPQAATLTGSEAQPFDFSTQIHTFKITVNGGTEQVVSFSPTPGVDFVTPAAATAAEVAAKLNTALAGLITATVSSGRVVITTVATGPNASITIGSGTANALLGFLSGMLVTGKGKRPAEGEEYFVTYKSARPESDFNRPILSTSFDQFIQKVGEVSSTNALALAGQIVFEQKPPFVYHIQVKNTGTGIAAQDADYITAIKAAELNPDITDVIVLGHPTAFGGGKKPLVRSALRAHVIDQSSLQNKAERLAWFGMPIGTTPGDGETASTFVYVATQELQVQGLDNPGHGRFILVGPSYIKKTYRLPDGSVRQFQLDSTYLAAGVAALNASFLSPATGLLRKEVVGFDEVEELSVGDRDFMASKGVFLVQPRGGVNVCFDPVTTDLSSAEFREINVMAQKDNIVRRVRRATDDALVGLVPDDLAQFIFELKTVVATQLTSAIAEGAIAPFQNDDGTIRNIDLQNDIIVRQRRDDPTSYDFRFVFFAKFIVKRLFGTFSVTIPSGA